MIVRDGEFRVLCRIPVSTIMSNPEFVRMAVEQYFNQKSILDFLRRSKELTEPDKDDKTRLTMPTPEEFARAVGFSNFASLKKAIEDTGYTEDSRHYLLVGCSVIADMLTRAGLMSKLDSKFTKFVMSAYLSINEKTETYRQEDSKIVITWQESVYDKYVDNIVPINTAPTINLTDPTKPLLIENNPPDYIDAEVIEIDRLEKALPNSMRLDPYKEAEQDDDKQG